MAPGEIAGCRGINGPEPSAALDKVTVSLAGRGAEAQPSYPASRATLDTVRIVDVARADARALARIKGQSTVSLVIPAKNEVGRVGNVVGIAHAELVARTGLVDEILVVDDGSVDATPEEAAAAGARVVRAADVLPEVGPGTGKGEALWKGLAASIGDLVVYCDADLVDFDPRIIAQLVAPLLTEPATQFVKGFYKRPLDGVMGEGGRVTELLARPLIATFLPHLASVYQPLVGEYAGRRSALERIPYVQGYGVDLAMLCDLTELYGLDALVQVDLGIRYHRNRSLRDLGPQAVAVLQSALTRSGRDLPLDLAVDLLRPDQPVRQIRHTERPPLATVPGYHALARP